MNYSGNDIRVVSTPSSVSRRVRDLAFAAFLSLGEGSMAYGLGSTVDASAWLEARRAIRGRKGIRREAAQGIDQLEAYLSHG